LHAVYAVRTLKHRIHIAVPLFDTHINKRLHPSNGNEVASRDRRCTLEEALQTLPMPAKRSTVSQCSVFYAGKPERSFLECPPSNTNPTQQSQTDQEETERRLDNADGVLRVLLLSRTPPSVSVRPFTAGPVRVYAQWPTGRAAVHFTIAVQG
jgi:hypothetical protein